MLQQTQTDRVIPFYTRFLKRFPTAERLAQASLTEVLILWSGLGYNRRAKYLHNAAKRIVEHYGGIVPSTYEKLRTLSGVGDYTASALLVFAYNKKALPLETNIRTVLIHHFLTPEKRVSEETVKKVLEAVLPRGGYRAWFNLLMDYGAHLKGVSGNKNAYSSTYQKQSAFRGSVREVRGALLRLLKEKPYTISRLWTALLQNSQASKELFEKALAGLVRDGLVQKRGSTITL